jgi:hypothetical protein
MIENINNQVPDALKGSSFKNPDAVNMPADKQLDASLDVKYESLIEKAMQTPTENPSAVEQAKQLLLSGQLDNPENIRAAAEAIIKFGI